MTPRKPVARIVREGRDADGPDIADDLADYEAREEEQEAASRSRAVVRPIRDEPDDLVFRFEVGPAILAQLLEKLQRIEVRPLSDALSARYPGFYQLFVAGEPKYIGKTARPVGERLREHARKLRHRRKINFNTVSCRYAFVEDPSLVDVAEGALIDFFGSRGLAEWNASGFGSKVTGYRRGKQDASEWAREYPPDLHVMIALELGRTASFESVVRVLKAEAPVTVAIPRRDAARFRRDHAFTLDIDELPKTFDDWMRFVEQHLHSGWRVNRQAESWYIEPKA